MEEDSSVVANAVVDSESMEILYYRKLAEYNDLLGAMACCESESERNRVMNLAKKAKKEVLTLGELLGKDTDSE